LAVNKHIIASVQNLELPFSNSPANLVREKPIERPAIGHPHDKTF